MKSLKQRIKALALETMPQRRLKLLPLVVDEHTTDAEIERLRRRGALYIARMIQHFMMSLFERMTTLKQRLNLLE